MTALSEYQRLECSGLWRETPDSQRRDVIVSFGDASLTIRDSPSERALSHWSLPAVQRLNPGQMPALFAASPEAQEELEIDDEAMIAAIAKVHAIIERRRPRPGRLRGAILLATAAAIAAGALLWLPGALIAHTAKILPTATRQDLGQAILGDLQRVAGSPCASPEGTGALNLFSRKLLGAEGRIVVLPEGVETALHLPGKYVVIGRKLLENYESPEVAAGYVLAERSRAETRDPVPAALRYAGLGPTFHLLTTGEVPPAPFRGYAEALLAQAPDPVDQDRLLERFREAGVGSSAYAYALDPSGETTLGLIEADPYAAAPPAEPLLADSDWVALQGICGG